MHKQMIMDGLDHGKLKVIERVCSDADIYTNMVEYHARHRDIADTNALSAESLPDTDACSIVPRDKAPCKDDNGDDNDNENDNDKGSNGKEQCRGSENTLTELTKKQKSSKLLAKSMSDWTYVKRLNTMLPTEDVGRGVPVFKVKQLIIMLNYLSARAAHLDSAVVAGINEVKDDADADADAMSSPTTNLPGYPESLYSSPFFCVTEPISISDAYTLSIIPSLLLRLEHVLQASDVKRRLGLAAKTETVRQAITATSASMDVNYERLETLGDSVLKLITTIALFVCHPKDHEGLLTSRRGRVVSNANLYTISKRLRLPENVITRTFSRREIRLPGFGWQRLRNVPRKWVAFVDSDLKKKGDEGESANSTSSASDASKVSFGQTGEPDTFGKASSSTSLSSDFSISSKSTDEIIDRVKREKEAPHPSGQCLTKPECSRKHRLSEKTVADIVESLLGASFVDGGLEGALAAARSLGIVKPRWASWSCFGDAWQANNAKLKRGMEQLTGFCAAMIANANRLANSEELVQEIEMDQQDVICSQAQMQLPHMLASDGSDKWVADVEQGLGYTFKNRALLVEALTHCSVSDAISDSYQRLEFLGDAIIDFYVTKRYYEYRPELRPYRITLIKHIAVSNDLLSIITVCHGFHRYIRHRSEVLAHAMSDYELRLGHARRVWAKNRQQESDVTDDAASLQLSSEDSECGEDSSSLCSSWEGSLHAAVTAAGNAAMDERPSKVRRFGTVADSVDVYRDLPPECWNMVPAPKILGDIFESLLGAVYIDSGMDNDVAQAVYEKLLSPFLDRFVDSCKLSLHPVIQCLLVCQGWGCDLITWTSRANSDLLEFVNKYICEVRAHGQVVATGMGESPRHAKYNAASLFLQQIGATAPDALSGELNTMHKRLASGDAIESLLRPICTCAERRKEEAAAHANSSAATETGAEAAGAP
ncbi:Dicer-like protein 1 [Coemansia sp. RSA 2599]|nr:Dicer-like protein 1 [Coemansia sp. RSA 2599]